MQMFLFAVYTELWKAICFSKCLFRKKKKKEYSVQMKEMVLSRMET